MLTWVKFNIFDILNFTRHHQLAIEMSISLIEIIHSLYSFPTIFQKMFRLSISNGGNGWKCESNWFKLLSIRFILFCVEISDGCWNSIQRNCCCLYNDNFIQTLTFKCSGKPNSLRRNVISRDFWVLTKGKSIHI